MRRIVNREGSGGIRAAKALLISVWAVKLLHAIHALVRTVHGNGERSLTTDCPSVAVTCDKDEVRRITPRDYRVPRQARGGGARLTFTAIANSRMRERHKKGDL